MKLTTSYKQILSISAPIMLASAAQNIIVLSDNVFLYHKSEVDFAAVGLVGVFYLIIASIGYGFSRGGQIMIARKHGELDYHAVGDNFKSLLAFEAIMSIGMFIFLMYGTPSFFKLFIDREDLYVKCLEYIYPRSFGVFFSYIGVTFLALYTGIARTKIIVYNTLVLIVVNIALNYMLIFGKFGFEPMGIAGAAWASTIAEIVAFIVFVWYMIFDKEIKAFNITNFSKVNFDLFKNTFVISAPIVWQSFVGLGSWFLFFSLIENMGNRQLEISNLIRNIYLILSIPCWGFSAGINTLVSNFIGNRKRQGVIPIIKKTALMSLTFTVIISIPVAIFPEFLLYPLFGSEDMSLIIDTKPYLPLLVSILTIFSIGSIFINGLTGTGHTLTALWIHSIFAVFYIGYVTLVINHFHLNLHWAWASEVFYWIGMIIVSYWYLNSKKWHVAKF
ncbi:MAG: MATE family efflux transporter [Saprospiraceae bacterium]